MSRRGTGSWKSQKNAEPVQAPEPDYSKTQTVDYYSANDEPMLQDVSNGIASDVKTGYWKKKRAGNIDPVSDTSQAYDNSEGGRIGKKKKDPNSVNKRLKKYVQPKNAAMCLNELVDNVKYTTEIEGTGTTSTCIVVEVGGREFRGYGTSKQVAKQAAAEAALVSFVKTPKPGEEGDAEDDNTPWAVLASFAMFKLFNDWREGKVGTSNPTPAPPTDKVEEKDIPKAAPVKVAIPPKANVELKIIPKPAKSIPTNATEMHPVMLLHQMRPTISFDTITVKDGSTVSCVIDGKTFHGEGATLKKAKLQLATASNEELFEVVTTWQDSR